MKYVMHFCLEPFQALGHIRSILSIFLLRICKLMEHSEKKWSGVAGFYCCDVQVLFLFFFSVINSDNNSSLDRGGTTIYTN